MLKAAFGFDEAAVSQPITPAKIEEMLTYVSPDIAQDPWIGIGAGIWEECPQEGFALWDSWSRKSDKFKEGETASLWSRFRHDHPAPAGIGSLIHHAQQGGYKASKEERTLAAKASPNGRL